MSHPIALADCNNFYASCERVFNPKLQGKPIIVLSNNDGMIIARSNEAKAVGIKGGVPLFQVKNLVEKYGVFVFSSNYTLYGDMSHRVMSTFERFSPEIEIYSIDEAFIHLGGFESRGLEAYSREIKSTVQQWTGIPVSIGIAATKTLAKMANNIAKKNPQFNGVLNLYDKSNIDSFLQMVDVEDVWGVGRQYSKLLYLNNIYTAYDLANANDKWIRKKMSVMGQRTVLELRGIPCIESELMPQPKQSIISSRSFGKTTTSKQDVMEAVALYTTRAAEKLRSQKSVANVISVFIRTNPFKNSPQYHNGCTAQLPVATDTTSEMLFYSSRSAEQIFKEGFQYHKVGVMLSDIIPKNQVQDSLFDTVDRVKSDKISALVDKINHNYGSGTIFLASCGISRNWKMKSDFKSKRFTTNWQELPEVSAKD